MTTTVDLWFSDVDKDNMTEKVGTIDMEDIPVFKDVLAEYGDHETWDVEGFRFTPYGFKVSFELVL